MKLIQQFVVIGFIILNIHAAGETTANLEKTVDDEKLAFSKTKFDTAFGNCFTTFKEYFDGLSASTEKNQISAEVGNYYKCATGKADYLLDGVTDEHSKTESVGHCKYLVNEVDGSEQLVLNKAVKRCYSVEESNAQAPLDGPCSMRSVTQYQNAYSQPTTDNTIGGSAAYDTLYKCIQRAIFYSLPYTERQFKLCEDECENIANVDLTANTDFTNCVKYSGKCARFQVLSQHDATSPMYATYFGECYDNGCYSVLKDATGTDDVTVANKAYVTCISKCQRPDYSYKLAQVDANVIKMSLIVLVGLLFALF